MTTQSGENVGVCAVEGNFDDAQTGVKAIFSDEALREELAQQGYFLSSANSINWGRVLPQIVYYISAYCDLLSSGKIKMGDESQLSASPQEILGTFWLPFTPNRWDFPSESSCARLTVIMC